MIDFSKGVKGMLSGIYEHNIDAKNRLFIPSQLRDDLKSTFIITRGFDECIYAYSSEEWKRMEQLIESMPLKQKVHSQRFFYAYLKEVALDGQGRIIIPAPLRKYAGVLDSKETVIVGAMDHVEIWNPALWEAKQREQESLDMFEFMSQAGL